MTEFPIRLNGKARDKSSFISSIIFVVLAVMFALLVFFNVLYTRIYVVGRSMEGTLTGAASVNRAGGDYVYICKYIAPKRGDIVVVNVRDGRWIIKRVIGLGGDTVMMDNGTLYLNGEIVDEPYVDPDNNNDPKSNTFAEITVEDGYVFFMGDNRDVSEDSRGDYGCRPIGDIEGVVADWSLLYKDRITDWNTFFEFTLPSRLQKFFN